MPAPPPTPPPVPPVAAAPARSRVIVELRLAPGMPKEKAIALAQDQVIAALPADRATVTQRYANLPLLALALEPALLDGLGRNPAVLRIGPDEMNTLQSK